MRKRGGRTILLTAWGGTGAVYPVLGVASELARRGHHPVVAAPGRHAADAAALGIAFQPLRPALPEDGEAARHMARDLLDPRHGRRRLWRTLLLPALRRSYDDLAAAAPPDLVVAHADVPAAPLLAEARRVPWLSLALRPALLAAPVAPALGLLRSAVPRLAALLLPLVTAAMAAAPPLAALRAELGLAPPPRGESVDAFSPHGVLALFPARFCPAGAALPAAMVAAGFVFYDGAARRPMPAELLDFLDDGAPPVVFTLGGETVRLAGDFFGQAIAAATRLGRRAVMLVGGAATLGTPPSAGVAVLDYAPHGQLLPRASAVVHHGGIGTTAQALRAARPMLITPFVGDQHDNARLAAAAGTAMVMRRGVSPAGLAEAVARLLAAPPQRPGALDGEALEDGAAMAADAIEAVVRGQPITDALAWSGNIRRLDAIRRYRA